ncbi:MAG: substrate-binding domain-containing protein, partial [Fimbriimonadaceae bacterium]
MVKRFTLSLLIATSLSVAGCTGKDANGTGSTDTAGDKPKVKIGFLVKSATEPWFQTEWQFADEAAKKYGVELIKLEVKDATVVESAITNLGVQGAQGVIICTPDQKLGSSIVKWCAEKNLKLMTVDDRLVDAKEQPLADVPHLGISATNIGKMVGETLVAEMKKRNWKMGEVGAIAIAFDTLETTRQRVDGAISVLTAAGFPMAKIKRMPWGQTTDIPAAMNVANVALTQEPNTKKWIAFSSNDDGVLGVVRAAAARGYGAESVIGVGINGTTAKDDFVKAEPTGMFG